MHCFFFCSAAVRFCKQAQHVESVPARPYCLRCLIFLRHRRLLARGKRHLPLLGSYLWAQLANRTHLAWSWSYQTSASTRLGTGAVTAGPTTLKTTPRATGLQHRPCTTSMAMSRHMALRAQFMQQSTWNILALDCKFVQASLDRLQLAKETTMCRAGSTTPRSMVSTDLSFITAEWPFLVHGFVGFLMDYHGTCQCSI